MNTKLCNVIRSVRIRCLKKKVLIAMIKIRYSSKNSFLAKIGTNSTWLRIRSNCDAFFSSVGTLLWIIGEIGNILMLPMRSLFSDNTIILSTYC